MNVEVQRQRMVRVLGEHTIKARDHLLRLGLRFPIGTPIVPGHGVHERLGVDRGRRAVLRVGRSHRAHGLRPGLVQRGPRRFRIAVIALIQRLDQRLLPRVRALHVR